MIENFATLSACLLYQKWFSFKPEGRELQKIMKAFCNIFDSFIKQTETEASVSQHSLLYDFRKDVLLGDLGHSQLLIHHDLMSIVSRKLQDFRFEIVPQLSTSTRNLKKVAHVI